MQYILLPFVLVGYVVAIVMAAFEAGAECGEDHYNNFLDRIASRRKK